MIQIFKSNTGEIKSDNTVFLGLFYRSSLEDFSSYALSLKKIKILNFVNLSQSSMKRNSVKDNKVVT